MSMRSSSGPDTRARYRCTTTAPHAQVWCGSPNQPQGHGFIAAASMNRAGYERLIAARAIVTTPSSIGWRSTSSTFLRNSGSSSRNSTPPCARLTSPGRGYDPPPISPASEIVWCGARNGRRATSDSPSGSTPATEWIFVVSSASSRLIFGRMVGSRRASIVFPDPGGPRSEEHTSELQSRLHLVCRLLLDKKKKRCHDEYVTDVL